MTKTPIHLTAAVASHLPDSGWAQNLRTFLLQSVFLLPLSYPDTISLQRSTHIPSYTNLSPSTNPTIQSQRLPQPSTWLVSRPRACAVWTLDQFVRHRHQYQHRPNQHQCKNVLRPARRSPQPDLRRAATRYRFRQYPMGPRSPQRRGEDVYDLHGNLQSHLQRGEQYPLRFGSRYD